MSESVRRHLEVQLRGYRGDLHYIGDGGVDGAEITIRAQFADLYAAASWVATMSDLGDGWPMPPLIADAVLIGTTRRTLFTSTVTVEATVPQAFADWAALNPLPAKENLR